MSQTSENVKNNTPKQLSEPHYLVKSTPTGQHNLYLISSCYSTQHSATQKVRATQISLARSSQQSSISNTFLTRSAQHYSKVQRYRTSITLSDQLRTIGSAQLYQISTSRGVNSARFRPALFLSDQLSSTRSSQCYRISPARSDQPNDQINLALSISQTRSDPHSSIGSVQLDRISTVDPDKHRSIYHHSSIPISTSRSSSACSVPIQRRRAIST
ncbi:hypothetical protein F511_44350 [Dorcoceras hygrometricum]|uniref:Uncharacterized protein n=1 Tax=Dorcoceras hygrometricum TaxID=472368 RepID=A0A2Z7A5J8_9LAMI|nr:hypothetical protein F511_44350 [Dorcoceras hygrometricum]